MLRFISFSVIDFLKKRSRFLLSAIVSCTLVFLSLHFAGFESSLHRVAGFPFGSLLGMIGLLFTNLFVVSFRFWRILFHFGFSFPWGVASRASLAGHVASQFFSAIFGQVLGRQLWLRNSGVSPAVNAALAAYERFVVLCVSGLFALIGGYRLHGARSVGEIIERFPLLHFGIVLILGFGISFWFGVGAFEKKALKKFFSLRNFIHFGEIFCITLLGQMLLLFSFVLGFWSLDATIPISTLFAASAVVSFAATIPITLNGWGVRELAAVLVFGRLGISASDAVAVSVFVGLCSMLVIFLAGVSLFKKNTRQHAVILSESIRVAPFSEVERIASWLLAVAITSLLFFQLFVGLQGGVLNLNIADPFAVLSLASVVLHHCFSKELPRWRFAGINVLLILFSLLLLFGFFLGVLDIGVTQWALGGRLLGWLILLGYMSAGYFLIQSSGSHGFRRCVETLAIFAVVIIAVQVMVRLLAIWHVIGVESITPNFEGYVGNRNMFAFQLLVIASLLLGLSRLYSMKNFGVNRASFFLLCLAFLFWGVVLSASRAGMVAALLMLLAGYQFRLLSIRAVRGIVVCVVVLQFLVLFGSFAPGLFGIDSVSIRVQSTFSGEFNNLERLRLFSRAVELWRESPIFGIGLGVFIEKSMEFFGYRQVVHSTPVWFLTEFGVLGLGVFVMAGWWIGRRAFLGKSWMLRNRSLLLLLLVFFVFGLVHEIFYQRIFWFALGLLLACDAGSRRMIAKERA